MLTSVAGSLPDAPWDKRSTAQGLKRIVAVVCFDPGCESEFEADLRERWDQRAMLAAINEEEEPQPHTFNPCRDGFGALAGLHG